MKNDLISINGKPLSAIGVTLLSGAYSALMTPAPLKDFVENDNPLKDGTEVLSPLNGSTLRPRIKERDITLTFLIQGETEAEFKQNYASFVRILHEGDVVLFASDLSKSFHLLYSNCTQFDNYRLNACKLAVKFREPNPQEGFINDSYQDEHTSPNLPNDSNSTLLHMTLPMLKKE